MMQHSQSRPARRKPNARRRAGRLPIGAATPARAIDLLAVLGHAGLWLAIVGYVAAVPATQTNFDIAVPRDGAILRNFYGIEQNDAGPFRWAKPGALISIPVSAPATYAVTLVLQDSPAVPAPRTATIYANGRAIGTAALGPTRQEFRLIAKMDRGAWGDRYDRMLHLEIDVPPFVPPADQRQLGAIVARVAVAPTGGGMNLELVGLALGGAGALVAGYALLRGLGLRTWLVAGYVGLILLGSAGIALTDRSGALALLYSPLSAPFAAGAVLIGLVGLPLLGGAGADRFVGDAPLPIAAPTTTLHDTSRVRLAVGGALAAITVLGLALRFYQLHHLSFWLDEAATVSFVRLPWPVVLGFTGSYDTHPPLYYALVKLVSEFLPARDAVRVTSAVAGAATLPVLAALVARLLNWRAGLVAALVLAVSPLHVWYSQEARMYTPVVLLVALTYLALLAFAQTAERRWGILYGCFVALALYVDYSASYALAPQVFLLGLVTWRWRRRALPIWGTALGAACCFIAWVPQLLQTISAEGRGREVFLGASPDRVHSTILTTMGLKNAGITIWGPLPAFWQGSPPTQHLLTIVLGATALLGAIMLARITVPGLIVALGLAVGTFVVAILVSLISPGFAERTILAATLGWAILLAAAGGRWAVERPRDLLLRNGVALVGLAVTVVVSVASLQAFYRGAHKTDYRALAEAASRAATSGGAVIAEGSLRDALLAYSPQLRPQSSTVSSELQQFWWANVELEWTDVRLRRAEFARLGFARLLHQHIDDNLFLDYYAQPGTIPDGAISLALPDSWQLTPEARLEGNVLRVTSGGRATLTLPARRAGAYLLALESTEPAQTQVTLSCIDDRGGVSVAAQAVATRGRELQAAILCPASTSALTVTVGNAQSPSITVSATRLWQIAPPTAATRDVAAGSAASHVP